MINLFSKLEYRLLILVLTITVLTSCAGEEKRTFNLTTNNRMHTFTAGDSYVYQIVGGTKLSGDGILQDIFGELQATWTNAGLNQDPKKNDASNILLEMTASTLSDLNGTTQLQYIRQEDDGSLVLFAETDLNGDLLWVVNSESDTLGHTLLTSPLGTTEYNINASPYTLQKCNRDSSQCTPVSTVLLTSEFIQQTTVKTPFAEFETFRYNINKSYTHLTSENLLNEESNQIIWIYPPLGIVRYHVFHVTQTNENSETLSYIANLVNTNIKF